MPAYAALLRSVNVGGTGKLAMSALTALCQDAGFHHAKTYIASGNVVFTSPLPEPAAKAALESRLATLTGKPATVHLRSAAELRAVLAADPFPHVAGNHLLILFLDTPPPADALTTARHRTDEQIAPGTRELYLHYPQGQGQSKLVLPAAAHGTARNRNTVARLAALTAALPA